MDQEFLDVLRHGSFAYPANSRYSGTSSVVCDRCGDSNIPACIGLDSTDLCMKCVTILVNLKISPINSAPSARRHITCLTPEELRQDHIIMYPNQPYQDMYIYGRTHYYVDKDGWIIKVHRNRDKE